MESSQFSYLLQHPESFNSLNTKQLDEIIDEFPYFQAARALQLKALYNTNSYKYNPILKKTAAYTIDRKVLFDYITSPIFINTSLSEKTENEDIKIIEPKALDIHEVDPKVSPTFVKEITDENSSNEETRNLDLGSPINFNSSEPHSFNEWMKLVSQKPIIREKKKTTKFSIIDTFIESNPKIKPVSKTAQNIDVSNESLEENDSLMTETLAKVYLEQKKYENAIKAYRILSLKYPEKSGFFADRIKAIKNLQRK